MSSYVEIAIWFIVIGNLVLFFAPGGFPPYDVRFESHTFDKVAMQGPLAFNSRLDEAEELSNDVKNTALPYLSGTESFAFRDGYIYSGIAGGDIVRLKIEDLKTKPWEKVCHIGTKEPCAKLEDQPRCGRPLGMRFDNENRLIVADAYYGIYRIDVDKKVAELLVDASVEIEGSKPLLCNSVAIAKDGTIYYSVSSDKYGLHELIFLLLEFSSPTGKIYKYDPKAKTSSVLKDGLVMANGLTLTDDEEFLIYSDCGKPELMKLYLKGPKKSRVEKFADTPGLNDNLTPNGKGGVFTAIYFPIYQDSKFNPLASLLEYPMARRYLTRIATGLKNLFLFLNEKIYFTSTVEYLGFWLAHLQTYDLVTPIGIIVEYDKQGKPVNSWQSTSKKVHSLTEANLHDGYLYLGTVTQANIRRVKY